MTKLLTKTITAFILLFSFSFAVPFIPLDINQLVIKKADGGASLNINYLQSRIQELSKPAGTYPTQFDSPEDQQNARQEITILIDVAKTIVDTNESADTLYIAMQVTRIAHNLDIKGAAEQSVDYAKRFIKKTPKDASGYFFLGAFLSETGKFEESKSYLNKALELGNEEVRWSIALNHLFTGDQTSALKELIIYQEKFPQDPRTSELMDGINNGSFEIKESKSK